jgi:hypothetical protein
VQFVALDCSKERYRPDHSVNDPTLRPRRLCRCRSTEGRSRPTGHTLATAEGGGFRFCGAAGPPGGRVKPALLCPESIICRIARLGVAGVDTPVMAGRRRQTPAEVFVESSAGLGGGIGVLRYAEHPIASKPARCPDPQQAAACIGHVAGPAISHILTAGLVGGLVGLGCALAIVLLLRLIRSGAQSDRHTAVVGPIVSRLVPAPSPLSSLCRRPRPGSRGARYRSARVTRFGDAIRDAVLTVRGART